MVFVGSPMAQVMNANIDNSFFLCALHDALIQRRTADFREQSEDIDLHSKNETSNAHRSASNAEL
jgi:hypothetical protein